MGTSAPMSSSRRDEFKQWRLQHQMMMMKKKNPVNWHVLSPGGSASDAASSSCLSSQEIERLRMDGASSVTIFPIERFKYVVRPVKEVTLGVAMGLYNIGYSRRGEEEPR